MVLSLVLTKEKPAGTAKLRIISQVKGAQAVVNNGKPGATLPWAQELSAGTHFITCSSSQAIAYGKRQSS